MMGNIDIDLNVLTANAANFSLNCSVITFRNRGQTMVFLRKSGEAIEIFPGMQETFQAPPGFNYITSFDIEFETGQGNLLIIKEHYN
jgi:hypothetical protein